MAKITQWRCHACTCDLGREPQDPIEDKFERHWSAIRKKTVQHRHNERSGALHCTLHHPPSCQAGGGRRAGRGAGPALGTWDLGLGTWDMPFKMLGTGLISGHLGQAHFWDMRHALQNFKTFKLLETGPVLGQPRTADSGQGQAQALQNSWGKPALGTCPFKCLGSGPLLGHAL